MYDKRMRAVLEEWALELSEHLGRPADEIRKRGLNIYDFPQQTVKLKFVDDSRASFLYAFVVRNEQRSEVAVFTEHCGYHVFPSGGLEVTPEPF